MKQVARIAHAGISVNDTDGSRNIATIAPNRLNSSHWTTNLDLFGSFWGPHWLFWGQESFRNDPETSSFFLSEYEPVSSHI